MGAAVLNREVSASVKVKKSAVPLRAKCILCLSWLNCMYKGVVLLIW